MEKIKTKLDSNNILDFTWFVFFCVSICHTEIRGALTLATLLVVFVTVITSVKQKAALSMTFTKSMMPFFIWYALFAGYLLLSQFWQVIPYEAEIPEVMPRLLLALLCMCQYIKDKDNAIRLLRIYIYAAFYGVVVFLLTTPVSTFASDYVFSSVIGLHRNILGFVFCFAAVAAFFVSAKYPEYKKHLRIIGCFCVAATVFTGSRTSLIFMIIVLFFHILFHKSFSKKVYWIFAILLLGAVAALVISTLPDISGTEINRFLAIFEEDNSDTSIHYRNMIRENAMNLFFEYPVLGGGMEAARAYNISLGLPASASHCTYTELLACYGVVGFVLYYSFFVVMAAKSFLKMRENSYAKFVFFSVVAIVITEYATVRFFNPTSIFAYCLLFGIYRHFVVEKKIKNKQKKSFKPI